jgi:hypothetical protein
MTTLTVTSPSMTLMLLQYMIEKIDTNSEALDELLRCGFSAALIDDLRHRPARDLNQLSQNANLAFSVEVEPHRLDQCLRNLDRSRRDKELVEYFVLNGASRDCLTTHFKLSSDDFRTLREQLLPEGAAATVGGRTRLPTPAVRDAIHSAWHALEKEYPNLPKRELLYRLHQTFGAQGHSIEALCATLTEFDDVGAGSTIAYKTSARKSAARDPGFSVPAPLAEF